MSLLDARVRLNAAKDAYHRLLVQVDAMLQAVVSRDPSMLSACEDLQNEYGEGHACQKLRVLEQPALPEPEPRLETKTGFSVTIKPDVAQTLPMPAVVTPGTGTNVGSAATDIKKSGKEPKAKKD